jgi:LysM repeat protein
MKTISPIVAFIFFLTGAVFAQAALAPIFSGVVHDSKGDLLGLSDSENGESQWLTVGEVFKGYVLVSYDAKTSTVLVRKNGSDFLLHLSGAKIPAVPLTFEERQTIIRNLRRLFSAAQRIYLDSGKPPASLADIVGNSKYVPILVAVHGEDYAGIVFPNNMRKISVTAPSGETVSYDEGIYFVRPGDTGPKIARANNISIENLKTMNPDVLWSALKVGEAIRLHSE